MKKSKIIYGLVMFAPVALMIACSALPYIIILLFTQFGGSVAPLFIFGQIIPTAAAIALSVAVYIAEKYTKWRFAWLLLRWPVIVVWFYFAMLVAFAVVFTLNSYIWLMWTVITIGFVILAILIYTFFYVHRYYNRRAAHEEQKIKYPVAG